MFKNYLFAGAFLLIASCSTTETYEAFVTTGGDYEFHPGDKLNFMVAINASHMAAISADIRFWEYADSPIESVSIGMMVRYPEDSMFHSIPFSELTFADTILRHGWNGSDSILKVSAVTDSLMKRGSPGNKFAFLFRTDTTGHISWPDSVKCFVHLKGEQVGRAIDTTYEVVFKRTISTYSTGGCSGCSSVRLGKITCENQAATRRRRS